MFLKKGRRPEPALTLRTYVMQWGNRWQISCSIQFQTRKAKINFRSTIPTSMIAGSAFETTQTLDIELKMNNVVGALFSRSFLLANITGTPGSDVAKRGQ